MTKRRILMTTALFYANGPIHLGHMVETIQADIWARWQRQLGHDCLFVSGDDAHGTAVMLSAQKQQISPETFIKQIHGEHVNDFRDFHISFDQFYTTHSAENQTLSENIYHILKQNGDISTRTITQAYDAEKNMFLADRFIRGQCPRCQSDDQYGDSCDVCGATYDPMELINARSVISGTTPTTQSSEHYFFELPNYANLLKQWIDGDHCQPQVRNKLCLARCTYRLYGRFSTLMPTTTRIKF